MAFTIRAGTPADIPTIATLEIAAHQPTSALLNINLLPPEDIHALFRSRYAHFLSHPDHYRFLVATAPKSETTEGEDIAGYLVGARPIPEGIEQEQWKPAFPEDADPEKMAWFAALMQTMKEDKMKYFENSMWELEALATSPSYQKRGVGSLLLKDWFEEVDSANGTLYVRASRPGRGLYEKFGCVNKGEHSVDVSDQGWPHVILNTNMIRAAKVKNT